MQVCACTELKAVSVVGLGKNFGVRKVCECVFECENTCVGGPEAPGDCSGLLIDQFLDFVGSPFGLAADLPPELGAVESDRLNARCHYLAAVGR